MKFCNALHGAPATSYVRLARVAEEAGFASLSVSDHLFLPEKLTSAYPYTPDGKPQFDADYDWMDPWVIIGAMAAVTSRLRFLTNVYVLPLRNPFVVAKAVSTAAVLSGERVAIGIGAGWMREEFEQAGEAWAGRGRRMEEMVTVLRTLWSGGYVEHHGEHYDFDRLEMRPAPEFPIPIYVGGHSEIALNRAARIGDGWLGVAYSMDELAGHCARIHDLREEHGTAARPFEIIASPTVKPTRMALSELAGMGVGTILTSASRVFPHDPADVDAAEDALRSFGATFIEPLG